MKGSPPHRRAGRVTALLFFVHHGCQMGSFCKYGFFASVMVWRFLKGEGAKGWVRLLRKPPNRTQTKPKFEGVKPRF